VGVVARWGVRQDYLLEITSVASLARSVKPPMNMECPECHGSESVTKQRQPFHFSLGFLLFAFLGGMIGGLFWVQARRTNTVANIASSSSFHIRV